MEARVGIEPTHKGFADLSLTTWVPRPEIYVSAGRSKSLWLRSRGRGSKNALAMRALAPSRWSGRRDLNPRLRPWQGRTLPLSYSRSATLIIDERLQPGKPPKVTPGTDAVRVKGGGQAGAFLRSLATRITNQGWVRVSLLVSGPLRILFGRNNLAVTHVNDLVSVLGGFRIVRDHQNGLAEFAIGLAQHTEHDRRVLGIQVAGGFVGEDERRLIHESAGQGDTLLLAARKLRWPVHETLADAQQISDAVKVTPVELVPASNVVGNFDVGARIEGGQQVEFLEDESNFALPHARAFGIGKLRKIVSINDDVARVSLRQASQ
jgi:hypothetical protein